MPDAGSRPPTSPTQPVHCDPPCGQPIFFALTIPGRRLIPVNATPDPDGILAIRHDVTGTYLARVLRDTAPGPDPATERRYTAHFATCRRSAQHRKRKPKRQTAHPPVVRDETLF
jgi:hypothetical protein